MLTWPTWCPSGSPHLRNSRGRDLPKDQWLRAEPSPTQAASFTTGLIHSFGAGIRLCDNVWWWSKAARKETRICWGPPELKHYSYVLIPSCANIASIFHSQFADQHTEAESRSVAHSRPHGFVNGRAEWDSKPGYQWGDCTAMPGQYFSRFLHFKFSSELSHVKHGSNFHVYWFKLIIVLAAGKANLNRGISISCLKRSNCMRYWALTPTQLLPTFSKSGPRSHVSAAPRAG